MYEASCLCGSFRFAIKGELSAPRFCHCANCTKFAGTTPASWAMTSLSNITMSASAELSKFDSGKGLRCFCARCGSPLWFQSLDYPDIVAIPLGVIDKGEIAPPEMHIWVQSKPDWCSITDGLPQHAGNPPA